MQHLYDTATEPMILYQNIAAVSYDVKRYLFFFQQHHYLRYLFVIFRQALPAAFSKRLLGSYHHVSSTNEKLQMYFISFYTDLWCIASGAQPLCGIVKP